MADTNGVKYFNAISHNKRQDFKLKAIETSINDSKKRVLLKFWKEKYDVMNDLVLLHVKTPKFTDPSEKHVTFNPTQSGDRIEIGDIKIDKTFLTNKPTTVGRKHAPTSATAGQSMIIDIQGSDAVCYPNSQAKHGRTVHLSYPLRRRLEVAKHLEQSLCSIEDRKENRRNPAEQYNRNKSWNALRPATSMSRKREFITQHPRRSKTSMGFVK